MKAELHYTRRDGISTYATGELTAAGYFQLRGNMRTNDPMISHKLATSNGVYEGLTIVVDPEDVAEAKRIVATNGIQAKVEVGSW